MPEINQAPINGQELLATPDTGGDEDIKSEATATGCSPSAYSLAQASGLRFADGRQDATIGKAIGGEYELYSEMSHVTMTGQFYVEPAH